jgi:membrane protease YdiL (CAAX protease family)
MGEIEKAYEPRVMQNTGFPPWTIRQLLLFLIVFWVFTQVVSFVFMVIFGLLLKAFGINLSGNLNIIISRHLSVICCLYYFIIYVKDKLRQSSYSVSDLWGNSKDKWLWVILAIFSGIIYSSFMLLVADKANRLITDPHRYSGAELIAKILLELLVVAVAVPIVEEMIFRGVALNALLKTYNPQVAYVLSAIVFTVYHLPKQLNDPLFLVFTFGVGIIASALFHKSGWLNVSIIFHGTYNATIIGLLQM